jgi:cytochrome P450
MENEGDTNGIINAIDESISYGSYAGLFPWIHAWVGLLGNLPGFEPSVNILVAFVINRIKAREKGGSERTDDFVAKLLSLEASGKNTRHDTFNACAQNIAAGSDTTAIALSSAVYHLAKNTDVLARLREELETAQSSGQASDPITFKEAQKLPYLQAVILEALRIHPAVGQPMTRVVPSGGAMISGFYFPAGVCYQENPR